MSDANNAKPQGCYIINFGANQGWYPITTIPIDNVIITNNQFSGSIQVQTIPPARYIQLDLEIPHEADEEVHHGFACSKCKDYNEFAEANMPDKTFMCYACRHGL